MGLYEYDKQEGFKGQPRRVSVSFELDDPRPEDSASRLLGAVGEQTNSVFGDFRYSRLPVRGVSRLVGVTMVLLYNGYATFEDDEDVIVDIFRNRTRIGSMYNDDLGGLPTQNVVYIREFSNMITENQTSPNHNQKYVSVLRDTSDNVVDSLSFEDGGTIAFRLRDNATTQEGTVGFGAITAYFE